MKKIVVILKAFLLWAILNLASMNISGQEASIMEELIPFTTYPFSDPDPVARPGKIYPYFRFDYFSDKPVTKEHKMIILENNWIKIWVAPDIGGKVWGALDKNNNQYFIYHNNVVKFRDIAMRGPWTSGGIEHNFGSIGHAPTVATPVDYYLRKNADGSVSCFVGSIELSSRTEWRVEIRVPADKAWFELRSSWSNPTDMKTSLYHWQTAAANGTDDLRFIFPGTAEIGHSGEVGKWPILSDGRDVSLYSNNNFGSSKSYHVIGEYTDWFAGYYSDTRSGFGHWTRQPVKPGKKIWIWSLARDGAIWTDLLTDPEKGNTQYIEMQTGLLFNQEGDESTRSPFKHLFFEPGTVEMFSELWFPINNLKGVKAISREGVLNVERDDDAYYIEFQALSQIDDSLLIEDLSGNILHSFKIELQPQQTLIKTLQLSTDEAFISLAHGELRYNLRSRDDIQLDRPLKIQDDFDWESVFGLYTLGLEKAKQRLYSDAESYFKKCLQKDKWFLPALTGLAEIDIRHLNYEDAEKKLLEVIRFNTYDPDANFLYGVLMTRKKEYEKARDAFGVTLRSNAYKSVSGNKLALIALRENRLDEAWEYSGLAGSFSTKDKNTLCINAVILRLKNDLIGYHKALDNILEADPLNHFARFEKYYSSSDPELLLSFKSGISNELGYETYVELALWYANAGLLNEALVICENSIPHPIADYLAAYLAEKLNNGSKSAFYLNRALNADDEFVFPYREEYVDILEWALLKTPSWKTRYYLALLYWSRQQEIKAENYFVKCGDEPDSYAFYLTRGTFLNQIGNDGEPDLLRALNLDKDNWRTFHVLVSYYFSKGLFEKALDISEKAMSIADHSCIISFDHAQALLNMRKYEECIQILENTEILPHEGAGSGRAVWKRANLMNSLKYLAERKTGKALHFAGNAYKWPENLGVGRPYKVDERAEDFISSMIHEKRGNTKQSMELLSKVADYNNGAPEGENPVNILSVISLRKLGRMKEADDYMNKWAENTNNSKVIDWSRLTCEGKTSEADKILQFAMTNSAGTPWNPEETESDFPIINEIVHIIAGL